MIKKKSIKIKIIAQYFPYGGASANFIRNLSFCLKEGGATVEVLLPYGYLYGNNVYGINRIRKNNINGVSYRFLGFLNRPKNILGKILDSFLGLILIFFNSFWSTIKSDLDIIICYNPLLHEFIAYYICKLLFKKKLILIISEFYEKPKTKVFSIKLFKWYLFYIAIKYFYKYADKIIVFSNYLKKYMSKRKNNSKNFLLIPNLLDPTIFQLKNVSPFLENYVTIGYTGTPTKKDGIFDLIKSFSIIQKNYKNTHLLIIGDITNGNTIIPELKKYASDCGIPENTITFTGLIKFSDIPKLLNACQILVLTRPKGVFAKAGFPTKLGEYFACKKPVVVTRVGDMANYFNDKVEVVFAEPENIKSIVDAISYLIENPDKAKEIGLNGYQWMNKNLNYKNKTNKLKEFVNN